MSGIQPYLNRITSQYAGKPRFMNWLTALLEKAEPAHGVSEVMAGYFDVSDAKGAQLDIVGEIVGVNRIITDQFINSEEKEFDDAQFRRLIQTRIIANQWNGQQGSITNVWEEAMDESLRAVYHDNQNMTITVDLIGDYQPLDVELVLRGWIVPKPMGVTMLTNMKTEASISVYLQTRSGIVGTVSRSELRQADADDTSVFYNIAFLISDMNLLASYKNEVSSVSFELNDDLELIATIDDSLDVTLHVDNSGHLIASTTDGG